MTPVEIRSDSEHQTRSIAMLLAGQLQGGDFVTLEGELGAGKTVFVRGLAEGLLIDPKQVSSPTFVIRQEYSGVDSLWTLVHVDAYRLSGADELETIGWSELLRDQDAIVAIEWPSRIADALPPRRFTVEIEHVDQHARQIRIAAPASMAERLAELSEYAAKHAATRYACRTCRRPVLSSSPEFPFCCERCRLADLGQWFNEAFRVSRPVEADDELND